MSDMMAFPETVEEFMEAYKVVDNEQVYSNGTEYVPIFRMRQWFEHIAHKQQEPCEDTISRQAVIQLIYNSYYNLAESSEDVDSMIEDVEALPSTDRKGHWILTQDEHFEFCTCSECGYDNGENWMIGSEIPFCWHCGADMRGEQDE